MILSFARARECVRCKRKRPKDEPGWGTVQVSATKGPLRWFQPRFRICPTCFDQMRELADRNPNLRSQGA